MRCELQRGRILSLHWQEFETKLDLIDRLKEFDKRFDCVGAVFQTSDVSERVALIGTGDPSVCYHHDGDGVCEAFERTYSIADCGFYTPGSFSDQWVSDVRVDSQLQSDDCPTFVVLGPPAVVHVRASLMSPAQNSANNIRRNC